MPLHKDVFCHPWSARFAAWASPEWCKVSPPCSRLCGEPVCPQLALCLMQICGRCIVGQIRTEIWLEISPKKKKKSKQVMAQPYNTGFYIPGCCCGTPQVTCTKHAVIHWYLIFIVFSVMFHHGWNYNTKYQVPFSSFNAICEHALIKLHGIAWRNIFYAYSIMQATSYRGSGAIWEHSVFVIASAQQIFLAL